MQITHHYLNDELQSVFQVVELQFCSFRDMSKTQVDNFEMASKQSYRN